MPVMSNSNSPRRNHRLVHCAPFAVSLAILGLAALPACGPDAGAEPLKLVPASATYLARLDAKRLHGSELEQRLVRVLKRNDFLRWKIDDFAKQTGVELLKHVDQVFVATQAGDEKGEGRAWLLVMSGRYDRARVRSWWEESTREAGGTPHQRQHAGFTIYPDKDEGTNLVFLGKRSVLVASKGWVEKALDLAAGKGQPISSRPAIKTSLERTGPGRIGWAIAHLTDTQRSSFLNRGQKSFSGLKSMVVNLDSAPGLKLEALVDNTTPDGARGISDGLGEIIKDLRTNPTVVKAGLAALLDKLKWSVDGTMFRGSLDLTGPQLDELISGLQNVISLLGQGGITGLPGMPGGGKSGGLPGGIPSPLGPAPAPMPTP